MYGVPVSTPMWRMGTTLSCSTAAAARASRRNRAVASGFRARSGLSTFAATRRLRVSSATSRTTPMPPRPISRTTRYSPRRAGGHAGPGSVARSRDRGTVPPWSARSDVSSGVGVCRKASDTRRTTRLDGIAGYRIGRSAVGERGGERVAGRESGESGGMGRVGVEPDAHLLHAARPKVCRAGTGAGRRPTERQKRTFQHLESGGTSSGYGCRPGEQPTRPGRPFPKVKNVRQSEQTREFVTQARQDPVSGQVHGIRGNPEIASDLRGRPAVEYEPGERLPGDG